MELYESCDIEFKITIIKMPYEFKETMHEQNENINKELENIRKDQTETWGLNN